jgi:hypothetical protein
VLLNSVNLKYLFRDVFPTVKFLFVHDTILVHDDLFGGTIVMLRVSDLSFSTTTSQMAWDALFQPRLRFTICSFALVFINTDRNIWFSLLIANYCSLKQFPSPDLLFCYDFIYSCSALARFGESEENYLKT